MPAQDIRRSTLVLGTVYSFSLARTYNIRSYPGNPFLAEFPPLPVLEHHSVTSLPLIFAF
jgi:hypothetical protein